MKTKLEYWDSSMLSKYMECPRKFFFCHLLGWRSVYPGIHLTFGSAWHEAMEVLLAAEKYDPDTIQRAKDAFLLRYRKDFSAATDLDYAPKNPGYAEDALDAYCARYRADHTRFEALHIEVGDCVEVDNDHLIWLKLDALCRHHPTGGVFVLEHKTTGALTSVVQEKWNLAFQIGTYLHALEMYFNPNEIMGVTINLAVLRKSGPDFLRIDTRRTPAQLAVWLWHCRNLMADIEYNLELLSRCTTSDPVLGAFPCNFTSCDNYRRMCEFAPYCMAWANPLQHAERPPQDFVLEYWDPRPTVQRTLRTELTTTKKERSTS